ncbi:transcriptional repressor NrdR [archaeon]|jgi:transcriptional repressor NrdR|nr:transcriptional repressor NrdR [archaeon]MBT4241530.1 transcriptional repressor NrdR [archaeon]MBT4417599.1 transcriptional repressor NrdR [archaeon]
MKCVYCGDYTRVTNKRESGDDVRRRRECLKCKKRFTTYERSEKNDIILVKKDGRRERFSKEKLRNGLMKACEKRPVPIEKIDKTVGEVEEKLRRKGKEIKSEVIGKMIMTKLKRLDKVAYIRFASVYRDFKDIEDFKEEIKEL